MEHVFVCGGGGVAREQSTGHQLHQQLFKINKFYKRTLHIKPHRSKIDSCHPHPYTYNSIHLISSSLSLHVFFSDFPSSLSETNDPG